MSLRHLAHHPLGRCTASVLGVALVVTMVPSEVWASLPRPASVAIDPNGNRASLTYRKADGATIAGTTYTYDKLNRLRELNTTGPLGTIQRYSYTLGLAGNRTKIEEHDGTVRDYTYDDLYRLTSETVSGSFNYSKTFSYDPVGNRLRQVTTGDGAGDISYTYDTRDRLLTEGPQAYSWDDNGNLTSKSAEATYFWDFENRLIKVVKADGTVVEHLYDPDGNRVQTKTTPGGGATTVLNYLVDTSGSLSHVVAETNGAGALVAYYVRADDLLAVMRPDGGDGFVSRFYHADGLGSIRRLTDEAGNITDGYSYSAFGELLAHTGSDPQPYTFAGEPYDPNLGFYYNRARWLDPRVGRFASLDPWPGFIYDPITLHKYVYARADPADTVDPTGLEPLPATIAALQIRVQLAVSTLGPRVVAAFAAGGAIIGRLFNEIGVFAQSAAFEVLLFYQRARPAFQFVSQRVTNGRVIDFFLKFGDRAAWLEVKYSLPSKVGDALTRLVAQIQAALAAAEGQVVVWTLRLPSPAQVRAVLDQLGAAGGKVQFVHGVEGLYRWLVFYFGAV